MNHQCAGNARVFRGVLLFGGSGNDQIWGGDGVDKINGNSGNDRLQGGGGSDKIWGGSGNDDIVGDSGNDTLYGDDGKDTLRGGVGANVLAGGKGNDILISEGRDSLSGGVEGGGDVDTFIFRAGAESVITDFNRLGDRLIFDDGSRLSDVRVTDWETISAKDAPFKVISKVTIESGNAKSRSTTWAFSW